MAINNVLLRSIQLNSNSNGISQFPVMRGRISMSSRCSSPKHRTHPPNRTASMWFCQLCNAIQPDVYFNSDIWCALVHLWGPIR